MPIVAVCPYCRKGSVRAPDAAVGLSIACPNCHSCFTVVPSALPGRPAPPVAVPAPQSVPVADATAPAPAAATATTAAVPAPALAPALPPAATPVAAAFPETEGDPVLPLALVAVSLAGVSLLLSQLPYGRLGAAVLAGLGLLLGLGSLLFAERRRDVAGLGAALNALVLLVVIALPGLLGLSTWVPAAALEESRTVVKAVRHDHSSALPATWVDVSQASWQLDDVRISVRGATIAPVELTGTNTQRRWTKTSYLQINLQVLNAGVARKIDFEGWAATAGPDGSAVRLTDAAGKALPAKTFDRGTTAAWLVQPAGLFPGKSAERLLVFEAPAAPFDRLRLELPGSAFGSPETVRLVFPRSFLGQRSLP
jgi:hypothetical protein